MNQDGIAPRRTARNGVPLASGRYNTFSSEVYALVSHHHVPTPEPSEAGVSKPAADRASGPTGRIVLDACFGPIAKPRIR